MVWVIHAESRTLLKARISASILSFFACSCASERPLVLVPFVNGTVVGPEGIVGACKFSIILFAEREFVMYVVKKQEVGRRRSFSLV